MCNESFTNFTKVLDEFSSNSSLKINYDKCFVKRVGPGRLLDTVFCENLPVIWTNDTISYLGIKIPNEMHDITNINFANKPNVIRDCLKPWEARKLSIMGKATILKCLAMPKLTYCFSVLPNPSEDFFHCVQNMFFEFLWKGKPDRIKRNVLINFYNESGLQIPHVKTVCDSLKASWVKRFLLDSEKWFFLKKILSDKGGFYFFDCNIHYRDKVLTNIQDDFYRGILEAWFLYKFRRPSCRSEYLAENSWLNSFITIDHNVVFKKSWSDKGVKTISDLCNNDDTFKD
ncbi:LINE-1 retrotransposable element ORF2 protein [Holothuria leucospilota]|uniref:LINE-1 retrotransposable element ORF2 protein n=1 Tax=Holothuria leucospilota TaxID=206669 RepID=A0A9Q1H169_HOLLE|nr:LINE-1 retrotransposable element ORF2 protein [Holothuria leucospilota]